MIRASAAAVSSAEIRSAGSLVSSASMTGPRAPARCGGGGSSRTTAVTAARSVSRSNGPKPSTPKYRVQPSEKRSAAAVGGPPVARSGARYPAVPTRMDVRVQRVSAESGWTEMP